MAVSRPVKGALAPDTAISGSRDDPRRLRTQAEPEETVRRAIRREGNQKPQRQSRFGARGDEAMWTVRGTNRRSRRHVHLLPIGLVLALAAPLLPRHPAGAAAAIAFRSSTTATGSIVALGKPAGVAGGDVLVAAIAKHERLSRATVPPAGWSLVAESEI